jgi:hypothetical protein
LPDILSLESAKCEPRVVKDRQSFAELDANSDYLLRRKVALLRDTVLKSLFGQQLGNYPKAIFKINGVENM